jgi:hypothetical protein
MKFKLNPPCSFKVYVYGWADRNAHTLMCSFYIVMQRTYPKCRKVLEADIRVLKDALRKWIADSHIRFMYFRRAEYGMKISSGMGKLNICQYDIHWDWSIEIHNTKINEPLNPIRA